MDIIEALKKQSHEDIANTKRVFVDILRSLAIENVSKGVISVLANGISIKTASFTAAEHEMKHIAKMRPTYIDYRNLKEQAQEYNKLKTFAESGKIQTNYIRHLNKE